jgi:iron complex transport system substrate-binding protein
MSFDGRPDQGLAGKLRFAGRRKVGRMKICSLLPSATDIIVALGLRDSLVAVTHECEVPPGTQPIPVITRSTLPAGTLNSREIDKHVGSAAHSGSSLYLLDHALLERCDPDLIITQELCEVCAIGYQHVAAAVRRLDAAAAATNRVIVSVEPQTLEQILEAIIRIGEAAGVRDRATHLVGEMRQRINATSEIGRQATAQPRVLAMEWLEPPYTAGHWVPEMIRLVGGRDELAREGEFSYEITWDDVAKYDPDILIVMPCSFGLEQVLAETALLGQHAKWTRLRAVRTGRVYAVDAARYFSRHGPRIVEGLAMLGEMIHPELFPRHAAANAWARLN